MVKPIVKCIYVREGKYPSIQMPPTSTSTHTMAYTTPINTVYEAGPQIPMLPMLMLQTEFISTTNPFSILTQEVEIA